MSARARTPDNQVSRKIRSGNILVLTALMLIPMCGFVAFGVDMGYICLVRNQLQNSADAGSLAGAATLYDPEKFQRELFEYTYTVTAPQPEVARLESQTFVGSNEAARVTPLVDLNPANSSGGDLVVGVRANRNQPVEPLAPDLERPDSVLVRVRMGAGRTNAPADLFFARVFGIDTFDADGSAMATVEPPGGLIPFGIYTGKWDTLAAGGDGDHFAYDFAINEFGVGNGSDGIPEIRVFPGTWTNEPLPPGNFGLMYIGPYGEGDDAGPEVIRPQLDQGVSESDLAYHGGVLYSGMELPGATGLKSGNKLAMLGHPNMVTPEDWFYDGILGEIRYLPVYSSARGNGSEAYFTIDRFVMVRIMALEIDGRIRTTQYDFEGNNISGLVVQPVTEDENPLPVRLTM